MSSTSRASVSVGAAGGKSSNQTLEHVDCGIIVVTYNNARDIERLLDSLPSAAGSLKIRCVVVDNNSSDETISILRSRNDIVTVEAMRNLGYSGAINLACTLIGPCSALMILNSDLVLEPQSIALLYQALDQPGVGIAVPM